MTDFATVNGNRVTAAHLQVTNYGPWILDLDLEGQPDLAGRVTAQIGTLQLSGMIIPQQAGTFGLQRKVRVVAGEAGWGISIPAKDYHNDAGVKARLIAEDAAREVGETIGGFIAAKERVGIDYVREAGPASRALEDAVGHGVAWWVDYAGVTQAGPRPAIPLDKTKYEVLFYDPRARVATLAVDDPASLYVGAVISERLDGPQVIRDFEIVVDGQQLYATAWCGGTGADRGRLAGVFAELVARATGRQLFGKYRYRVLRTIGDRVELQAVRKDAGLPDIVPVALWPGVPGVETELASGAEVLVEFIEGDRTLPVLTHFAGKHDGGPAFVPISLTLCGSSQRAARQGDLVQSGGAGAVLQLIPLPGNLAPAVLPATPYFVSFSVDPAAVGPLAAPLFGAISTGSPKVRL